MNAVIVEGDHILERFDGDEPVIHDKAALLIEDGVVRSIGPVDDLRRTRPDAQRYGGQGSIIIPGLIDAHHHVGLTPFQAGSPDHALELWFASRLGLRAIDPRLDTLYSAFEMIASGVTTVQHLHSRAPGGLEGLYRTSEAILSAYDEIGMRVSFSMALRDQNRLVYGDDQAFTASVPEPLRPALSRYFADYTVPFDDQINLSTDLIEAVDKRDRQQVQLAPANLHWLSDPALDAIAELSAERDLLMHAHVLETAYQWDYARQRTGGSAVDYLAERGLLTHRLTLGHGVWMSEADIERCADEGCCICHNCSSNLRLKSGIAPVNRYLAHGLSVALGMDEAGINEDRDMLQEMRLVKHMHREPGLDSPAPTGAQVMRMATEHGAKTTPFGNRIGSLSPGSCGDIVVLDWKTMTWPYQDPALPLADVIVHRAKPNAVRTVLIGGEAVYHEGRFTHVDRASILEQISETLSAPPDADTLERRQLAEDVMPHVRAFYETYDLPVGVPQGRRNLRGEP